MDFVAGRRIQHGDGRPHAQRDVDRVAVGDQAAHELSGPSFERPQMRMPCRDGTLPKDDAAESVPCNERPSRRHLHRPPRPEIHDVEDSPFGRDHSAQRRHVVVVTQPTGPTDPLKVLGRTDHGVLSDCVVVGIVQVMRPFIDVRRPRLDDLGPGTACDLDHLAGRSLRLLSGLQDQRHAIGGQHPFDFVHREVAQILDHEQVYQLVDIGQVGAVEGVDGDSAVQSNFAQVFPSLGDVFCAVKSMDAVTLVRRQCRRQSPVTTTDMDDQPSLDAGRFEDLLSGQIFGRINGNGREGQCQGQHG